MVKWKRSQEGFIDSHDGDYAISPLFWGCLRPQAYELNYRGKLLSTGCDTQFDAKVMADQHQRKMATEAEINT